MGPVTGIRVVDFSWVLAGRVDVFSSREMSSWRTSQCGSGGHDPDGLGSLSQSIKNRDRVQTYYLREVSFWTKTSD
jgi:hypothetical protein